MGQPNVLTAVQQSYVGELWHAARERYEEGQTIAPGLSPATNKAAIATITVLDELRTADVDRQLADQPRASAVHLARNGLKEVLFPNKLDRVRHGIRYLRAVRYLGQAARTVEAAETAHY